MSAHLAPKETHAATLNRRHAFPGSWTASPVVFGERITAVGPDIWTCTDRNGVAAKRSVMMTLVYMRDPH